jgi:diphthamide synthase (EF-2-diphthine--ammonia ligase)
VTARCSWSSYDEAFTAACAARADGITHVVFGDLVYPEHREWAEARCAEAGVTAVEPLFGMSDRRAVRRVRRVRAHGADGHGPRAVARRDVAGPPAQRRHEGRLRARGIDPCGERGEYHTAVVDSPLFSHPVAVTMASASSAASASPLDLIVDGLDSRCCRPLTSGFAYDEGTPSSAASA